MDMLKLEDWELTKIQIHLQLQIVGKIKLALHPKLNHWWHVTFFVNSKGYTTGPIPYQYNKVEFQFNYITHQLEVSSSDNWHFNIPLEGNIKSFYEALFKKLNEHISVNIRNPRPFDMDYASTIPFAEDEEHNTYDSNYATKQWKLMLEVDTIFQKFRGMYDGKSSQPQIFWHHFDNAITRFTGKDVTVDPTKSIVEREAYNKELTSYGFWFGDNIVREPAFYAYAAPASQELYDTKLEVGSWNKEAGMALLMLKDVLATHNPEKTVLQFLNSVYQNCQVFMKNK